MTDRMTFTATGGQTAGPTDFGCTPLEIALKGQLKSIIIKNRMCILHMDRSIFFKCTKSKISITKNFPQCNPDILDQQRFIFA